MTKAKRFLMDFGRKQKRYYNWWCSTPVGEKGIEPIELIIE